jgi:tetratricopeptide (TPR) repeat protein
VIRCTLLPATAPFALLRPFWEDLKLPIRLDKIPENRTATEMLSMKPYPASAHLTHRTPRPASALGILLCWLTAIAVHATCTAPPSMKSRLQSQPTAQAYADLGKWFGDQKQFHCAAEAFAAAVKLEPDSASLDYLWGLSLYSAGDTEAALAPLRKAANLGTHDVQPHLVLGAALDRLGQTPHAEREWRAALAIDPGSAAALDGLSSDLLSDKDYAEAITLLEQPARREKPTPLQSLNLGMAYARTLQLNEAARVLREGLDAAQDSLALADELAVVLMLLDRPEEAETILAAALALHPADLNTKVLYLRVLISSKSDTAQQFGRKLLLAAPHNWEVLYLNAQLEIRSGEFFHARAHLEQSVALKRDYFPSDEALGNVLSNLKDFSGAKQHLQKAIELGDTEPAVQYELAMVLKSLGETEQAQEKLRTFQAMRKAEADQTLAVSKIESGDRAMASGDAASAVALYREALADDPNEARVAYKLAKALEKTNDLTGERAELERAIELNPNLAEAQNQLGYLTGRSGDLAQAEICYRAAIKASPSYLVAWINLAATLADEAKWQDAKEAIAHALEIDPDSAAAHRLDQAITAARANP